MYHYNTCVYNYIIYQRIKQGVYHVSIGCSENVEPKEMVEPMSKLQHELRDRKKTKSLLKRMQGNEKTKLSVMRFKIHRYNKDGWFIDIFYEGSKYHQKMLD